MASTTPTMVKSLVDLPEELVILTLEVGRLQIADGLALRMTSKRLYQISEGLVFWLRLAEHNDTLPVPVYQPLNNLCLRDLKDICIRHYLSLTNLSSGAPQYRRHRVIPFHDEEDLAIDSVIFLPGGRHILIINDLGDVELWDISRGSPRPESKGEDTEESVESVGVFLARYSPAFQWWSGVTFRALGDSSTGVVLMLHGQSLNNKWLGHVVSFEDLHLDDVKTIEHCVIQLPYSRATDGMGPGDYTVAINDPFLAICNVSDSTVSALPFKVSLVNWRSKKMVTIGSGFSFAHPGLRAPDVLLSEEGDVSVCRSDGTGLDLYTWYYLLPHLRDIPTLEEDNEGTNLQLYPDTLEGYVNSCLATSPELRSWSGDRFPRFLGSCFGGQMLLLSDEDLGISPVTENIWSFDASKLFPIFRPETADQDQPGVLLLSPTDRRISCSSDGYAESRNGTPYLTKATKLRNGSNLRSVSLPCADPRKMVAVLERSSGANLYSSILLSSSRNSSSVQIPRRSCSSKGKIPNSTFSSIDHRDGVLHYSREESKF